MIFEGKLVNSRLLILSQRLEVPFSKRLACHTFLGKSQGLGDKKTGVILEKPGGRKPEVLGTGVQIAPESLAAPRQELGTPPRARSEREASADISLLRAESPAALFA